MTARFHRLRIAEVRRETAEALSVRFEVPRDLAADYAFVQGQHLTLRTQLNGQELRRSYSVCSGVDDGELRIAIKRVPGGLFSEWAMLQLRAGEAIDVLTPEGGFHTPLDPGHRLHYVAFAAGSGITPILSILRTTLAREPHSRFSLVYCNQRPASALFQEELEDLKDRYLTRFALYNVFTRQPQEVELFNGRLDRSKVNRFLDTLLAPEAIDHAFICGPGGMIDSVRETLLARGLAEAQLHTERFGIPAGSKPPEFSAADAPQAVATMIADGRRSAVNFRESDASLLDAGLRAGLDLPYSCKGGMCCTCRAKLLEGQARMARNFGLEKAEVEAGYILTCQARPLSKRLTLSYDER
ncbi:MAG TPA: 1,2-phenylacetyl-CoA epoxidase subunit PaaE [Burkholderiales bacterium]|nr:1,2-phenylacetyl-CoA epoxidase subunit PaaE [Burkholderiales bacterium]